ncbi:MAG: transposase, partial [Cyanobacteria bacterium J06636_16]
RWHQRSDKQGVILDSAFSLFKVTKEGYDTLRAREEPVKVAIPPQKNAKIWQHGNCKAPPHPRDANLRAIRQQGRNAWKRQANYHRRSLAETTMFRFKTILGGKVRSRSFDNQATELLLQCAALNRMIQLAKPDTVWVDD